MTIKHTVSLARAKKLKKLGWEKETLFIWRTGKKIEPLLLQTPVFDDLEGYEHYPAPIASEILEKILYVVEIETFMLGDKVRHAASIIKMDLPTPWHCKYEANTPANALADCWIYLKGEKLI